MKRSKTVLKETFSDEQILERWICFGSLNFAAIEILRKVEGLEKGQHGILPSSSHIQQIGAVLSEYTDGIIPFESFETKTGEGIKFDALKMTYLLLYTYSF